MPLDRSGAHVFGCSTREEQKVWLFWGRGGMKKNDGQLIHALGCNLLGHPCYIHTHMISSNPPTCCIRTLFGLLGQSSLRVADTVGAYIFVSDSVLCIPVTHMNLWHIHQVRGGGGWGREAAGGRNGGSRKGGERSKGMMGLRDFGRVSKAALANAALVLSSKDWKNIFKMGSSVENRSKSLGLSAAARE